MDNDCVIVSYDVFMDNSTRVSTVVAARVEGDVVHARELKQSGSGGKKGGSSGAEDGSGSSTGRKSGGQNGSGCERPRSKGSESKDERDSDDDDEERKNKKVSPGFVGKTSFDSGCVHAQQHSLKRICSIFDFLLMGLCLLLLLCYYFWAGAGTGQRQQQGHLQGGKGALGGGGCRRNSESWACLQRQRFSQGDVGRRLRHGY